MSQDAILTSASRTARLAEVRVWDPLVRIFHWSLVGLVAFAFLTGEEWNKAHIAAGYAILALVALRIVCGLIGTKHARFCDFLRGPRTVLVYVSDVLRFRAPPTLGHNPLGGLMIVAWLAALIATGASGYMITLDSYRSAEWLERLRFMSRASFFRALHMGKISFER